VSAGRVESADGRAFSFSGGPDVSSPACARTRTACHSARPALVQGLEAAKATGIPGFHPHDAARTSALVDVYPPCTTGEVVELRRDAT
jgi:hypothetical protein